MMMVIDGGDGGDGGDVVMMVMMVMMVVMMMMWWCGVHAIFNLFSMVLFLVCSCFLLSYPANLGFLCQSFQLSFHLKLIFSHQQVLIEQCLDIPITGCEVCIIGFVALWLIHLCLCSVRYYLFIFIFLECLFIVRWAESRLI